MSENPNRVSRRNIINGLAATGIGVSVLGSSSRLSPTRTAEASGNQVEYATNFGDKYEYRHEDSDNSSVNHDGSLGVQAGVVQTGIGKDKRNGCWVWEHYVTVWAFAPFIRIFDDDEDGVYQSGCAMDKQTTDISTYADTSCISNAPLDLMGSRFVSLHGQSNSCPYAGTDDTSVAASYYENDNTYEGKDYDGYSDVKDWSEEYEKESESDRDDFNEWPAAIGTFTGIVGLAGFAVGGPLGYASLATAPPSFFQLFSELAQGNGATLDGNNQEISFSNSRTDSGLMGNLVEFKIVADAEEKFKVGVESNFDVEGKSKRCYGAELKSNVDSRTCFNINVPWNSADTEVKDAQRIDATECGEH